MEELYNFMDVHPEQNGNFEQLMTSCPYGCLINRAFLEIRQSRLKKEPMLPGDCVKRTLPKNDYDFIEQQYALQKKLDDFIIAYSGQAAN